MPRALLITVNLHADRYHGAGDWPPSPGRLFQALVAGAGPAQALPAPAAAALQWLERQPPPLLAAPRATRGQAVLLYVPNNDLDAKGGDPAEVSNLRVGKEVQPWLLPAGAALTYAWPILAGEEEAATALLPLCQQLYQLGRGVDLAWATGEIVERAGLERQLAAGGRLLWRPDAEPLPDTLRLACPCPGTLESLTRRYQSGEARFGVEGSGKDRQTLFQQPPQPLLALLAYGQLPARRLFDLRQPAAPEAFAPVNLRQIAPFTEAVRDHLAARLTAALPTAAAPIDHLLRGQPQGGQHPNPADRPRLLALPSIGHTHVDQAVRRLLIEVPPSCPLTVDDLAWGLSGLQLPAAAHRPAVLLVPAEEEGMLRHYGSAEAARAFVTITPIALPIHPTAGEDPRTDPGTLHALQRALHHAGIHTPLQDLTLQREPIHGHGRPAADHAPDTRFAADALWHAHLVFAAPLRGPLVVGNGRFVSLGLLAPLRAPPAPAWAAPVTSGLATDPHPIGLAEALRRAVMAVVAATRGSSKLPAWVSGHAPDGGPLRDTPHLSCAWDAPRQRLLVIPPAHISQPQQELLSQALSQLTTLRAGEAGLLQLDPFAPLDPADPLLAPACQWQSATPYAVNRHHKLGDPAAALARDLDQELRQRGLPTAEVTVLHAATSPSGLTGSLRLTFAQAQAGPLLLGRTRHRGGGLFVPLRAPEG
jgi:CRISPR-associated protein Csb2